MPNLFRNNANHHSKLLVALCLEVLDSVEVILNNRIRSLISIVDSRRLNEGLLIQLEHSDFSLGEFAIKCNVKARKWRPETRVL